MGLEPTRPCGQGILSPSCLPFHHQSFSPLAISCWLLACVDLLSGKRDSNSRPRPWQGRALPTELFPQSVLLSGKRDSNSRPRPWQGRALPTELFPHRFSLFQVKRHFFFWKAGAKVQTFFHSAKLFLKKNCNTLIYNQKYFTHTSLYSLQFHS